MVHARCTTGRGDAHRGVDADETWGRCLLMPPLTHYIGRMRANGGFTKALLFANDAGGVVDCVRWAALTFGWFLTVFSQGEDKDDLAIAMIVWSPVLVPVFWTFFVYRRLVGDWICDGAVIWPLTQYSLTAAQIKKPRRVIQRIGKIKFGKYGEPSFRSSAEWRSVRRILTDGDAGELYAHQSATWPRQRGTIQDLVRRADHDVVADSIAQHRLRLANLKLAAIRWRRAGAGGTCRAHSGTHLAMMARQRIKSLPGRARNLRSSRNRTRSRCRR